MQYHLNGFRPGSPHERSLDKGMRPEALPATADVVIVGCGPAGLTLAAQMAQFGDISTVIVDHKAGPLEVGQADGIACRSVEMFEAFGFAERVLREAYWVNETTFWKPDGPGKIVRSDRIDDTEPGLSEFPHVILSQARVHDFYLDVMRQGPGGITPYYGRRFEGLEVGDTTTVRFDHEGHVEEIRAKYVIGCDGARSGVRRALGLELAGDAANKAWGVMDVLVDTDFPDIRLKTIIHSADEGSVLIIPREGGYMVRLYVELEKLARDERVGQRNITQEALIAAAGRILAPYRFDVKEVAWWSVYEIGQRLCARYDNGTEGRAANVFIAGDAAHTHSPKAGQGMNVSMADAFNLGWKLAAVLRGQAGAELLDSYSGERQAVAQELIDFDRELAQMFATKPAGGAEAVDPKVFQQYFQKQGRFTAGTSIQYGASGVVGDTAHQHLATGFEVGTRFHSAPVTCVADAKPVQLGHMFKADGRWRIVAFAPEAGVRVGALCDYLESAASPLQRYTPEGADMDAVIDFRAVFQQGHREIDVNALPALLRPKKGKYQLTDHEKAFAPALEAERDIFDMRGIDRKQGCMLVLRPDQVVAQVLPLDGYGALEAFFAGVLTPRN